MFSGKHVLVKTLSVACAAALLFQCTPVFASAEENAKASADAVPAEVTTEENTYAKPAIVGEDTSLRQENVKQFRCSDGSYIAAIYDQPVHYLKDGKYEDIDNTLVAADDADDGYYVNKDNAVQVKMPKEAGGDKPVTISDGTNSLSWSIPVGGEISAQVAEAAPDALAARADAAADGDGTDDGSLLDDAKLRAGRDDSEVTYSDADTGVDYR